MKLMIASDIHGFTYYCKQLLNAFEAERADWFLLLVLADYCIFSSGNQLVYATHGHNYNL